MGLSRKYLFLFAGLLIIAILCMNWIFFYSSTPGKNEKKNWAEIEADLGKYHNKYYDQDEMYFMAVGWPTLVEAVEKMSQPFIQQAEKGWLNANDHHRLVGETSPLRVIENKVANHTSIIESSYIWKNYWEECWADRTDNDHANSPRVSFFRLSADPICSFLWMIKLRQESIENIDRVLAVVTREDEKKMGREDKPQQNGGMRATLSSGLQAYWKPCTKASGNGESYLPEIMAYHIDRIVQFNRAPAVVPRYISSDDFYELASRAERNDPDVQRKVDSILRNCGQQNEIGAEGSFVGWSPFEVELLRSGLRKKLTPRLGELTSEELEIVREQMKITRNSNPKDIEWALELVTGHMFGILVGTLSRFRHNQHFFVDPNTGQRGPMIFIDNDRSQWDHTPHDIAHGNPLQEFCIFPERLSKRILMLSSVGISLGDILVKISDIYKSNMKESPMFTVSMRKKLQSNINWLAQSIYECIKRKGEEAVLIPEYWESSSYDNFNLEGRTAFFEMLRALTKAIDK